MNESRIETITGMCVVALTKHLMDKNNLKYELAYKRLLNSELYKLLQDCRGIFINIITEYPQVYMPPFFHPFLFW